MPHRVDKISVTTPNELEEQKVAFCKLHGSILPTRHGSLGTKVNPLWHSLNSEGSDILKITFHIITHSMTISFNQGYVSKFFAIFLELKKVS